MLLDYDDWYLLVCDELEIEIAERGLDRELDFDPADYFARRYEQYTNQGTLL